MAIPDFQTLMRPVLRRLAGRRQTTAELVAGMAEEFRLTDHERLQLLPSGKQATIANCVHWALSHLGRAGLVTRVSRGVYEASDRGKGALGQAPERIDIPFLRQYPLLLEGALETDVYVALWRRIGLFQSVVGGLQPILARMPRLLGERVLAGDGRGAVEDVERAVDAAQAEGGGFDLDATVEA